MLSLILHEWTNFSRLAATLQDLAVLKQFNHCPKLTYPPQRQPSLEDPRNEFGEQVTHYSCLYLYVDANFLWDSDPRPLDTVRSLTPITRIDRISPSILHGSPIIHSSISKHIFPWPWSPSWSSWRRTYLLRANNVTRFSSISRGQLTGRLL